MSDGLFHHLQLRALQVDCRPKKEADGAFGHQQDRINPYVVSASEQMQCDKLYLIGVGYFLNSLLNGTAVFGAAVRNMEADQSRQVFCGLFFCFIAWFAKRARTKDHFTA